MREVKFVDLGKQYLAIRDEILAKFDEVSRTGSYVLGPEVSAFEEKFARYCGVEHAIGVGNGSDALFLSLLALGVGSTDEVITVPNSFVATAWVIARTGARPVFCDVGDDMNMDPVKLKDAITDKTKAILPVHLTGRVADMEAILDIAGQAGVAVVEDAAQAVGARYKGKMAGSFGKCAGFSLHPLKNLHVHGDGGVITTGDAKLAETLLQHRNHGLKNRDECAFWGINSRLDAVHAGIANVKLDYLDGWNVRFRGLAARYSRGLADVVAVPTEEDHEEPVYHRYMIRHSQRDELQTFLAGNGIETKVNYSVPLHLQPAASDLGYSKGDFPVAEEQAGTILSLPLYAELEDDAIDYVVEKVREYCEHG